MTVATEPFVVGQPSYLGSARTTAGAGTAQVQAVYTRLSIMIGVYKPPAVPSARVRPRGHTTQRARGEILMIQAVTDRGRRTATAGQGRPPA